jgi:alcohol dehydrogenase (cytochrome c)/quinohemoprotein ethanol dehydrogenase
MRRRQLALVLCLLSLSFSSACKKEGEKAEYVPKKPADVDAARILQADHEPGNWLTHGRTYGEQRYSPLTQISDQNANQLGLAWSYDLDTNRGQEATPLVIDGVMYFTSAWSKAFALDAASGKVLWTYDPQVPKETGVNVCCDVVNRGLAAWNGKLFLGTLDGRLVALDAATGKEVWKVLTVDPQMRYSITGAPRVVKGKVIIGNGGAEMGVRGHVSAFDAETGKLAWRFYTVPGDPSKPFENSQMEKAAKTWNTQWWKFGGGGTVWNSMSYDPELDLLYIGTGNRAPWSSKDRGPKGSDSLFTCSIVALKPDTGEYVWHYQEETPDVWDFDADEDMILADLPINGQTRKVLMQAPKNGISYVLDRATGALISAQPFTFINWATGVDMATGRPVETPNARYGGNNPPPVVPGPLGAHSWQPMAFNPQTGLVYIPVNDVGFVYKYDPGFKPTHLAMDTATDAVASGMPQDPKIKQVILATVKGKLVAWDPIQQKQAWAVQRPGPWNGGVLTTAGNLVFEGTADGHFEAYSADKGAKLWSFNAQTGVMAGPVTYTVNGEQYVAVLAGWGGVFPLVTGEVSFKSGHVRNVSRMLVFKLGGKATLPMRPEPEPMVLNPPPSHASAATIHLGEAKYQQFCSRCHGDVVVGGGLMPDLRYSGTLDSDQWFYVVMDGLLKSNGMVSFKKDISRKDAAAIREYVIFRANQSKAEEKATPGEH